jgi:hypothetical protein
MGPRQRLDKGLWFARVAKTRSLAARLIAVLAKSLLAEMNRPDYKPVHIVELRCSSSRGSQSKATHLRHFGKTKFAGLWACGSVAAMRGSFLGFGCIRELAIIRK